MRKIISYFIRFDVAVNVIILAFLVFGIVGASRMTSSFFPLIDSQIINININYPGAAPQEIEEGIVLRLRTISKAWWVLNALLPHPARMVEA